MVFVYSSWQEASISILQIHLLKKIELFLTNRCQTWYLSYLCSFLAYFCFVNFYGTLFSV